MSQLKDDVTTKAKQIKAYLCARDNILGATPIRTFTVSRKYGFNGKVLVRITDTGRITITYTENTLYRTSSMIKLTVDRIKGVSITGQRRHLNYIDTMKDRDCYQVIQRVMEQTFPDTGVFS